MGFLEVLKSRGIWSLLAVFVIVDLIVIFTMKEFRAYWTLFGVEALSLVIYTFTRLMTDIDKPIWFLKDKE